jgi:hypothetical protein
MAEQETLLARKKRGPKPTGKGQQVVVRCQPDLLAAMDTFRLNQKSPVNRAAVLRQFAIEALKRRGLLKTAK